MAKERVECSDGIDVTSVHGPVCYGINLDFPIERGRKRRGGVMIYRRSAIERVNVPEFSFPNRSFPVRLPLASGQRQLAIHF